MSPTPSTPAPPPTIDPIPPDLKPRIAASYNAIAPTYNAHFTSPSDPLRLSYLTRLSTLLQPTSPPAQVLELGCGAGIPGTKFLLEMNNATCHVTANDISSTQLSLAGGNLGAYVDAGRLDLVQGDMHSLSFSANSLDAVVALYSIIHLPRSEQTSLVDKIGTWLKPGGYLLANFTVEEAERLEEEMWLGEREGWMFWSGWGGEGSVGMVERAGLEVLVKEERQSDGDARFVWVVARKKEEEEEK